MMVKGVNFKILAWPKLYSFISSEIAFYVAISIG
jgi:hypothetical protein